MPQSHRRIALRLIRTAAGLALAIGSAAGAQPADPTPIKGLTDRLGLDSGQADGKLLGGKYENSVAGLTFRPPADLTQVKRAPGAEGNIIADFTNDEKQWLLKVTKPTLAKPLPLQTTRTVGKDGKVDERQGLLDWTVAEIVKGDRTAQVERNEIINVGEYGVGLAIIRVQIGTDKFLRQQAIFQVDEQNYFIFNLTTPGAKNANPGEVAKERLANDSFMQMIDSVQILDQSWIRKDQVQRLFRTRTLFVDWAHLGGQRLKQARIPEKWLRLVKDGKDIGYSVEYEDFVEGRDVRNNPGRLYDGILISVRSRTIEGDTQVDVGSQLFTSLDRKHEDWTHIVSAVTDKGKPNQAKKETSEYGFNELKSTRIVDRDAPPDPKDPKAPPGRNVESYRLNVTRPERGKSFVRPEFYAPSPWYIPQAVGVMLPRLLPLNKPVTYMFQTYVGDQRAVVHRYVDVGFEKEVTLDGQTVRVVPITDRLRLEGAATIHYMSPEGKWLGSVNEEAHVTILPTDEATLKKIWANADFSKPQNAPPPGPTSQGEPAPRTPAGVRN